MIAWSGVADGVVSDWLDLVRALTDHLVCGITGKVVSNVSYKKMTNTNWMLDILYLIP